MLVNQCYLRSLSIMIELRGDEDYDEEVEENLQEEVKNVNYRNGQF